MDRVEFIGVPGVGKSTIRNRLVKHLQQIDKSLYLDEEQAFLETSKLNMDKIYRLFLNIFPEYISLKLANKLMNRSIMQFNAQNKFLAKHGKLLHLFLGSSQFDNMSINDRSIVIGGLLDMGSLFECIDDHLPEKTIVFFEEGFVQKSFMFVSAISGEYDDKTDIYSYLDLIPLPRFVICIKANLETCYERMVNRPSGVTDRLKSAEKNAIFEFLHDADAHVNTLISWLQKKKDVNVLVINNEKNIETVLKEVESEFVEILGHDI